MRHVASVGGRGRPYDLRQHSLLEDEAPGVATIGSVGAAGS